MSKEKVTKVRDGDTFETNKRKNAIRLIELDTPEKGQPGYTKAKNALEDLILGEEVTVNTVARDKFGRALAKVMLGRRSVNKAMKKYEK
jgi:micrococcal nuclease